MNSIALIEQYYKAFNERNWAKMLSFVAEDICHEINEGPVEIGLIKFAAFLEVMNECYEEKVIDLVIMGDAEGNRIGAEFYIDGRYLKEQSGLPEAIGQSYNVRVGAFFELKNGKITRVTTHYNLKNWINLVRT